MVTLEEYAQMNKTQQNNVKKAELQQLIDSQLTLLNNDPNELRNVITSTINQAMDKKFEQFITDFNTETKRLSDENIVLRKVILEQQKCLTRLCNDKNKDNVFITGIPTKLIINNETLSTPKDIITQIMQVVSPDITNDEYKIIKSFNPREGQDVHSAKVTFTCSESKKKVMSNSKKLKELEVDNLLRKVYIKNESTPLVRKENDRLFTKLRKLKEDNPGDADKYKIVKGKLMDGINVIDEFNISNSIF